MSIYEEIAQDALAVERDFLKILDWGVQPVDERDTGEICALITLLTERLEVLTESDDDRSGLAQCYAAAITSLVRSMADRLPGRVE